MIVDFIGEATKTIDVAVQELDNPAIAEALIAAKLGGRSVRIILNHSYLQDESDKAHRPAPGLTTVAQLAADESERKINRDVFAALCRAGIEVRIDLNPVAIFHQKFCVRDLRIGREGDDPRQGENPGLLTGSANFTSTDCHTNLNHLLVFDDLAVQMDFAAEFAEAWGGEFSRGRLGKPPKTHDVGGVPVKVLFSPDHGPEAEVVKQLLKCPNGGQINCAMRVLAVEAKGEGVVGHVHSDARFKTSRPAVLNERDQLVTVALVQERPALREPLLPLLSSQSKSMPSTYLTGESRRHGEPRP